LSVRYHRHFSQCHLIIIVIRFTGLLTINLSCNDNLQFVEVSLNLLAGTQEQE
jgi:hypothetical protein